MVNNSDLPGIQRDLSVAASIQSTNNENKVTNTSRNAKARDTYDEEGSFEISKDVYLDLKMT